MPDLGLSTSDLVLLLLLVVSELLSFIPQVKSNGVFQLAFNFIKIMANKFVITKTPKVK